MIDWDRVADLRGEVGAEDFGMIVDIFADEVGEAIAGLRSDPDPASYEQVLHFLKGSALNIGFAALGRICQQGELLAAEGRIEAFELEELFRVYDASWVQFREGLARCDAGT